MPEDFTAIQSAISAASSGDSIFIGPGTYHENLNTHGKFLSLIGTAGPDATVIDGGRRDHVFLTSGGCLVEGLSLRNGQAQQGGGAWVTGPGPTTFTNVVIQDNIAGLFFDSGTGGGIYLDLRAQNVMVQNSVIRNNYAGDTGGGIWERSPGPIAIHDNLIACNGCHVGGGGLVVFFTDLSNNLILGNWSEHFGDGILSQGATIRNNTIVSNHIVTNWLHGAGIQATEGIIINNIITGNHGPKGYPSGMGISCDYQPLIQCNDIWNNDGDPYYSTCDTLGGNNISADPLFCDPAALDFRIASTSPCAPSRSGACGLIGAFPVDAACMPTRTRRSTWGQIKQIYR